ATGRKGRPEGDPREHGAVLEGENGRAEIADPRIDDRARARLRGQARTRGDHAPPDMKTPPAQRARWTREHTMISLLSRPLRTGSPVSRGRPSRWAKRSSTGSAQRPSPVSPPARRPGPWPGAGRSRRAPRPP